MQSSPFCGDQNFTEVHLHYQSSVVDDDSDQALSVAGCDMGHIDLIVMPSQVFRPKLWIRSGTL